MRYEVLHLKDRFLFLGENGCDPTLERYIPENIQELDSPEGKRPRGLPI